jgi:hypothetical protein
MGGPTLNLPFSPDAWRAVHEIWHTVGTDGSTESSASVGGNDIDAVDLSESEDESEETDDEYVHLLVNDSPDDGPSSPAACKDSWPDDNGISVQPHVGRVPGSESSMVISASDDPLLTPVAQFCAFICTEAFHNGKSSSTIMIYFAGVLGIVQDGLSFERPSNYTSKLSAIIHIARLCLLEVTLPRFPHPHLSWRPRPRLGQDKILNKMREDFACQDSPAPLSELLSLRAYGRVLARTDGPAFRVDWAEDGSSVKWDDGSLTMAAFRNLGHHAPSRVQDAIGTLMGEFRPNLNLSLLRNRISEQSHGYSFMHDPKNEISSAYMDLASKICTGMEHGLMIRN